MELAARLPLETDRSESRYAWIERFLSAETIDDMAVMAVMSRRLLATLAEQKKTIVVSIDQTALDDERAIGMMSARIGELALPLFWIVKRTAGNIAIKEYLPLLDMLKSCTPEGADVLVLGDRLYGSPDLIKACQTSGFRYRFRLRGNLTLTHQGGELHVEDISRLGCAGIADASRVDHCLDVGDCQRPSCSKKTTPTGSLKQLARSALSLCKQGLRYLARCAQLGINPEPLKIMGW